MRLSKHVNLKRVGCREFGSGAVILQYEPGTWVSQKQ